MNQKLHVKWTKFKAYLSFTKIWVNDISNLLKKYSIGIAVFFFVITFAIYLGKLDLESFGLLVAAFGSIFAALKYNLDQANYQKSLFEERFAIFLKTDQILSAVFQDSDKDGNPMTWRDFSKELDSIYRKSYFLFSKETYEFIDKFRKAVIQLKMSERNNSNNETTEIRKAEEFLLSLLEGQVLSKKFPEIKIDFFTKED